MTERKRVFSGIQPSGRGELHIGNLVGALTNWVVMQETHDCIYSVVDLHALTAQPDPDDLARARLVTAKTLLAVGIDPERALVYYQSDVPEHSELSWLLGTLVGMGQLERMTQYKEKSDKSGQLYGIFAYPVLQAADILIHKVHAVPVGDDQTQHLELTRDLAQRFNNRFGPTFPLPERITPKVGARVMSLQDPTSKMSKSDANPAGFIMLTEPTDSIRGKVRSAVTDSDRFVRYDWDEKPGVSNLLELFGFFSGRPITELVDEFHDGGYGRFKEAVAEAIVAGLEPIRSRFDRLDDGEVAEVMRRGAARARRMATPELESIKRRMGLRTS